MNIRSTYLGVSGLSSNVEETFLDRKKDKHRNYRWFKKDYQSCDTFSGEFTRRKAERREREMARVEEVKRGYCCRCAFPIDLNFHENSSVSSRDGFRANLETDDCARASVQEAGQSRRRNLSGYHQPPQSVKRQLQALFCARPDCRQDRSRRHAKPILARAHSSSAFSCTDTRPDLTQSTVAKGQADVLSTA